MFDSTGAGTDGEFRALYDETAAMLRRIAYRVTSSEEAAEDIVHDSYIKAVERWHIFPTRDDAKYWLIRVVKNNALNYAKRKSRENRVYQRYFAERVEKGETPEGELEKSETIRDMRRYVDRLPENLRSVIVLKEYGLLSYKEIGKALGITEGNVKVRVFRAREAVAAMMREEDPDVSRP